MLIGWLSLGGPRQGVYGPCSAQSPNQSQRAAKASLRLRCGLIVQVDTSAFLLRKEHPIVHSEPIGPLYCCSARAIHSSFIFYLF